MAKPDSITTESDNPLLIASDHDASVSDDLNERDYVEAVTTFNDKECKMIDKDS